MKLLLKIVVIALVVGGLAYGAREYYFRGRAGAGNASAFRTAELKRGDLVATISATGTVEPEEVIDVGAQVAGQILKFGIDPNGKSVDYGSPVEIGTILAEIDPSLYQSDVDQATATLEQSKASLARAQADLGQMKARFDQSTRDWNRAQKLGPSDALSQTDYDAYEAAYEIAKANVGVGEASVVQADKGVAQAQATRSRVVRNLGYTTIKSPVKGVIIDRRVNIGQTVVSSLNAPSLFLIAKDLTKMQVWASVNEADIGSIRAGQPVTFTVDAFPGRTFEGTVGKVRLNATMTQNVVTYTVEILTDNSDGALLPYLTANVTFNVAKRENAMLVPNAALRWSPSSPDLISPEGRRSPAAGDGAGAPGAMAGGGERRRHSSSDSPTTNPTGSNDAPKHAVRAGTIWVTDGDLAKPIRVRTGLSDGSNTEVMSQDLKEGMSVIIGEAGSAGAGADEAKNPFAPQMPRGSRRGM